jgi:hypothetical protein
LRINTFNALAAIGGEKAGQFLLNELEKTSGQGERLEILNLLGQIEYEAALPKTIEILRKDPDKYYWQSIFVFGKMGDKAIPFLLSKIDDEDMNIRRNAIMVLGQWLLAPEAIGPFQRRFWVEKEWKIRHLILISLDQMIANPDESKRFFKEVAATDKQPEAKQCAEETLALVGKVEKLIVEFRQKKKPDSAVFDREYAKIYKSGGREGDMQILSVTSSTQDESRLKKLRQRILQRNSDEAFEDYKKINDIITRHFPDK